MPVPPVPALIPMFRFEYDPAGQPAPYIGRDCKITPPKMIMCGANADHVLLVKNPGTLGFVDPDYWCCCPKGCEELTFGRPPEYGICHCFSGKKDGTGEDCDMIYTATFSGPAIGAPCAGPHTLTERWSPDTQSKCYWDVNFIEHAIPGATCPERCPGDDARGDARNPARCFIEFHMTCFMNPCGKKTYYARINPMNFFPHRCPEQPCGDGSIPWDCHALCYSLESWIPSDICGCPKIGTYAAIPFSTPGYWCSNAGTINMPCDPYGPGGGGHTVTIARVHTEDCRPFACAKPPCTIAEFGEV